MNINRNDKNNLNKFLMAKSIVSIKLILTIITKNLKIVQLRLNNFENAYYVIEFYLKLYLNQRLS